MTTRWSGLVSQLQQGRGGGLFQVVSTVRGSRQVLDQIRGSIEDGTLKPGTRLPSERELAVEFGVSRATIREAIQSLSSLGLLEVRQGVGTLVSTQAITSKDPAYWLPWLSEHRGDVVALLEVRETLEVKSAHLAARTVASGAEGITGLLGELKANLMQMREAAGTQDLAALEKLDLQFHSILARLGGNPYLAKLSKSINHVFSDRRAAMAIPGRAQQSCEEHNRIITAVCEGRTEAAGAAMAAHLASTRASVEELTREGD